jgi:hypothetical protein
MIDQGALKWHSCYPSCSATQALLNTISYARQQGYFSSTAAIRDGSGKTVVTQFGLEAYKIDWPTILSANNDLHWIFENAGGFTNPYTVGAYGWLSPKNPLQSGYEGLDYTQYFEKVAGQNSAKLNWASTWKGFNDTVASWAPPGGRHIEQLCGKSWLDSWAAVRAYPGRLDAVQVVTWHDYEEGTEVQSGIDNCQMVTAKVNGNTLSWSVADSSTLDHYTAYISADGQNLMSLGDFDVDTNVLDLSSFNFAPGTYQVYVKAVGKPTIVNQMSAAASYTVAKVLPVVTITSPYNNQQSGPYTDLRATASSQNGVITQYSILVDGNLVQTLLGAPSFQYWTPTPTGVHVITVKAQDAVGQIGSADVTVNRPYAQPVVTITSPYNNQQTGAYTDLRGTASSQNGAITQYSILMDGTLIQTLPGGPSFQYSTPTPMGVHVITVQAQDVASQVASANVTVNRPYALPVVTITSPYNNQKAGPYTDLKATASSQNGAITQYSILVDGKLVQTLPGAPSFEYWTPTPMGVHVITVKAQDAAAQVNSTNVTINRTY